MLLKAITQSQCGGQSALTALVSSIIKHKPFPQYSQASIFSGKQDGVHICNTETNLQHNSEASTCNLSHYLVFNFCYIHYWLFQYVNYMINATKPSDLSSVKVGDFSKNTNSVSSLLIGKRLGLLPQEICMIQANLSPRQL